MRDGKKEAGESWSCLWVVLVWFGTSCSISRTSHRLPAWYDDFRQIICPLWTQGHCGGVKLSCGDRIRIEHREAKTGKLTETMKKVKEGGKSVWWLFCLEQAPRYIRRLRFLSSVGTYRPTSVGPVGTLRWCSDTCRNFLFLFSFTSFSFALYIEYLPNDIDMMH